MYEMFYQSIHYTAPSILRDSDVKLTDYKLIKMLATYLDVYEGWEDTSLLSRFHGTSY